MSSGLATLLDLEPGIDSLHLVLVSVVKRDSLLWLGALDGDQLVVLVQTGDQLRHRAINAPCSRNIFTHQVL